MRIWRAWTGYWFRPAPLAHLAVLRVVAVGFQLYGLVRLDHRRVLQGLEALPDALYDPLPVLRLLTLPLGWRYRPPADLVELVYWATLAAGVLALVGLRTNAALAVFAVGNVFVQAFIYSFGEIHHPEAPMMIALSALALSPAGRALSLDDLLRRLSLAYRRRRFEPFDPLEGQSPFARWPLLVVQWMLALVYLSAAWSKLAWSGLDWMNGYTLRYFMVQDGLRWGSPLGVWLGQHHTVAWLASWVAILFEGTFFLVLLVPALALVYVPVGAAFHTGIYLIQRAPFFQLVALYVVFVPWVPVARAARRIAARRPRPEVLFDGRCPLCIRSMTVLRYADWLDRLAFTDVEARWPEIAARRPDLSAAGCRREMHVLLPDGSVRRGFFGLRALIRYLPPLWPLLPLVHVPGASAIGSRVYALLAARRTRFEGCSFETCSPRTGREA